MPRRRGCATLVAAFSAYTTLSFALQPAWVGCKMPRRSQLASAASAESMSATVSSHERAAKEGRAGSGGTAWGGDDLEFDDS